MLSSSPQLLKPYKWLLPKVLFTSQNSILFFSPSCIHFNCPQQPFQSHTCLQKKNVLSSSFLSFLTATHNSFFSCLSLLNIFPCQEPQLVSTSQNMYKFWLICNMQQKISTFVYLNAFLIVYLSFSFPDHYFLDDKLVFHYKYIKQTVLSSEDPSGVFKGILQGI